MSYFEEFLKEQRENESFNIQDIINCVFKAIGNYGVPLSKDEYEIIGKRAWKLIKNLMEIRKNKGSLYAKFAVEIPVDVSKATIRNRTVRNFLKKFDMAIHTELKLVNKMLILTDSYDVHNGQLSGFPIAMKIKTTQERKYSYVNDN